MASWSRVTVGDIERAGTPATNQTTGDSVSNIYFAPGGASAPRQVSEW